jgi:bifunctional NMN adenylyltransferase/nudix hydrolase
MRNEGVIDDPIYINNKQIKDMKEVTKQYSVGIVIGRFQLADLHEAHKELIDTVLANHPKVIIFLGLSQVRGSINDPLDFQPRKQMILEAYPHDKYPNLTVGYIKDQRSDDEWSKKLDAQINDIISQNDSVVLYGSRDSFLKHYTGRFDRRELQATRHVSGTELRAKIAQAPQSNPQFRAGAIWLTAQRYPTVYSTVDVIVFDPKERKVLLARKPLENKYRFIGGFVDPIKDDSFEEAACRELYEEATISVGLTGLRYVGSKKVNDWRYANNPSEKIMTHVYVGIYNMGCPRANDDIAEVRFFDYEKLAEKPIDYIEIVEEHLTLWEMAKVYIETNFPVKEEKLVGV